jgi:hypothetical protein
MKRESITYIVTILLILSGVSVSAQQYEIPPTEATRGYVPVISDEQMEECIKLYNEANWLEEKIDSAVVNRYEALEVEAYNADIERYSNMTEKFNRECAGKQSKSACEAARKLNAAKGIKSQSCN